jgi:diguanylate cyclase (GGDEF)-like protein
VLFLTAVRREAADDPEVMSHRSQRHTDYLIPFLAVFALTWAMLGLSTDLRLGELLAALALQAFVTALLWTWKPGRRGTGRFILATVALDVSIGLMRDASGVNPGVAILLLMPALLAAGRASRGELTFALVAVALVLYVPEIFPAGDQYPASALRPVTMELMLGVMMGEVVLRLVRALSAGQELQRQMMLEARSQLATEDALRQVATCVAMGAPAAQLFTEVSQQLARIAGSSMGAVIRFDQELNLGTLVGGWRADGSVTMGRQWDLRGETAAAEVSRTGATVTIATYPESPDIGGAVAAVSSPIVVSGRLWGAASAVYGRDDLVPDGIEVQFERFCELVAMAIANAEAVSELVELATIDSLTGTANRRSFDEELNRELERGSRVSRPLALVLLDIDRFKAVNDNHGHQAGDRVLAGVAAVLMAQARAGDMVARLGGEEFVWLMPDTTAEEAFTAAERARREITELDFDGIRITLSAGVNSNRLGAGGAALLAGADRALYMAKAGGRDQTVAAPASLSSAEERVKPAAA